MTATPAPKIDLTAVDFSYGPGEPLILDGVDLAVAPGEFLALVGASGCGKSTLLRLIAGLTRPRAGHVRVDGADVTGPSPDRGMVFQDDAVFPWLTVGGNVAYGLKNKGVRGEDLERRVAEALNLVGLATSGDLYPRQLSGGMRKRVDVARAIALEPEIVLMDEPFAALDVMTKQRLQEDFLQIWSTVGMTVVFVTHDLEEALFQADRVAVMAPRPGRLVHQVEVPFARPRSPALRTDPEFQSLRRELTAVLSTTTEAA